MPLLPIAAGKAAEVPSAAAEAPGYVVPNEPLERTGRAGMVMVVVCSRRPPVDTLPVLLGE